MKEESNAEKKPQIILSARKLLDDLENSGFCVVPCNLEYVPFGIHEGSFLTLVFKGEKVETIVLRLVRCKNGLSDFVCYTLDKYKQNGGYQKQIAPD